MKEENVKSEYQRKVDKSLIPTCNIMGVNIAAINMNWLLKYIDENLSDIKGDYICVSNVHTTVTSYEDSEGIDGLPKSDVLKFFLEDNCSIVVRPSGTEPKLKAYISVSATTKEEAQVVEGKLARAVEEKM